MNRTSKRQQGSALIISLGVLTAITLGASLAMQQSSLQVKMVSNMSIERQVFTGSISYLERAYSNLTQNGDTTVLSDLIQDEQQALSDQLDKGTSEADLKYRTAAKSMFSEYGWDVPATTSLKAVSSNSTNISYMSETKNSINKNTATPCLKCNSGNSAATSEKYPFLIESTSTDKSGLITSTQQIALLYEAAPSS